MKDLSAARKLDLLIAVIVVLLISMMAGYSHAATCVNGSCRQSVVTRNQLFVQPLQYQVGAHFQQQASSTYNFRQSDEYQRLQYLEGFYEGVQSQGTAQVAKSAAAKDAPAPAQEFSAQIPTIVKHCASCHSGKDPKGGLWLDGSVDLRSSLASEKRDKIIRAVYTGTMPKNKGQLDGVTFGDIIEELYAESQEK